MSGNKSKKKAIDEGQKKQAELTEKAMQRQQPFVDIGVPATQRLNYLSGGGTEAQQEQARADYEGSLFNTLAMGDYERDRGRIADSLGSQGVVFSSGFLDADANAYADHRTNGFANYLNNTTNLANIGVSATGAQTNLLANQGNSAAQAGYQKANVYRSPLDTLQQVAGIGSSVGNAFIGFG